MHAAAAQRVAGRGDRPGQSLPLTGAHLTTSPSSMRSAPSNCTSKGRRPMVRSAASRASARNSGISGELASCRASPIRLPWRVVRRRGPAPFPRTRRRLPPRPSTGPSPSRWSPEQPPESTAQSALAAAGPLVVLEVLEELFATRSAVPVRSGQIGATRVGHRRVGQDIDDGGNTAVESPAKRRPQLRRRSDQLAVAARARTTSS